MSVQQKTNAERISPFGSGVIACGAFYLAHHFAPLIESNGIINVVPAIAVIIGTAHGANTLAAASAYLAGIFDIWAAKTPRGRKGQAAWTSWKSLCKRDVKKWHWAPYWGTYAHGWIHRGKPICADYSSNCVTIGTAGSGKGVGVVLPTCLAIRDSKLLADFKGANICMLKKALEKRGEIVIALNIGGMHTDILGETHCYNPSNIVSDDFERPGGLNDVGADAEELANQLYPEPAEGGNDRFWRDGSRTAIQMAILATVLVRGKQANLGQVSQLLDNRAELLNDMLWACGRLKGADGNALPPMPLESSPWAKSHDAADVSAFVAWYRNKASALADLLQSKDDKVAESFLTGARQALSVFNGASRAAKVLSRSTFRFGDMKEGTKPVTVSIVIDASRLATQGKIAALLQWCAFTEFKRHPNFKKPVYFIADETTNFKIDNLPSLQTWGREYGIRWHGFVQSLSAYRTTYGKEALNVLLSETEIKQFLPQQREPETLDLISKLLAQKSVVNKTHNGSKDHYGIHGFGLAEDSKPLMDADEIRRTDKAILFIRGNRPVLTDLPPIASIHPWRKQIGNNPFYKKRWLLPIRLRIRARRRPFLVWLWDILTGGKR